MADLTPLQFTSGLPNLDRVLGGIRPGDNVVLQVDSIEEYLPFVLPFCQAAQSQQKPLVYFRFADHRPLLPDNVQAQVFLLHPENGFETFIDEVFDVIERFGRGACYVFDSLTDLAADWYSDRMLGNFFMLTCPYLYRCDTVAYFALLKHYHSFDATHSIQKTAQVVIHVHRHKDQFYLHPQKVWQRSSPTMYMLHRRDGDDFLPVTMSAAVAEILARVPQPWLDFTAQRLGIWPRTFMKAQEALIEVNLGKRPADELDFYFDKLLRMAVTREPGLLRLAEKYLELEDILVLHKRMIGTGLIGGKSAGMLLARSILRRADKRWRHVLEEHDSFYIGSDVFYTYLVENDCWWVRRNQRDPETLLDGSEEASQRILTGVFPPHIVDQFREMLDYFGQAPIIVRSSSLLEDNYGNAFSGKYESVFCANQGSPQERLEVFMDAVRRVYASTMSHEALTYRAHRGLLDKDEQMALLVQRVSGAYYGQQFFPQAAGVGFSFNPYVWSNEIDPKSGVLRLVFGLGTRAVDRSDDDYTRIVALNAPRKRPEASIKEARRYTQRKVDLIDVEHNTPASRLFEDVARAAPGIPLDLFASPDEELEQYAATHRRGDLFTLTLTFDRLLCETDFVRDMRGILEALQAAYGVPVDVEFTVNFLDASNYRINIVQCRPFQVKVLDRNVELPANLTPDRIGIESRGPIIGGGHATGVDRLIYVVPELYGNLPTQSRHAVARLIGKLTHLKSPSPKPSIMLLGPGRWGTSSPELGVPVTFAEINTVSAMCELAMMHEGLVPDVSLGTHFFNDLVEADISYLAVYPHRPGYIYREPLLRSLPNSLTELLPGSESLAEVVRVIDFPTAAGTILVLNVNPLQQRAVVYTDQRA